MESGPLAFSNTERAFSNTIRDIYIGDAERVASIAVGLGLAVFGLAQRS